MLNKLLQGAAIVSALFLFAGCVATKKNHAARLILQGIDTTKTIAPQYPEPVIQKGDLLTIVVYSDNPTATQIYNQSQSGGDVGVGGGSANMSLMGKGYQVDAEGQIFFHTVGNMSVVGMTKAQLASLLKEKLTKYLQNPYVTVRYTNSRLTILGEVAKPGIIELPDQKISILDAIGLAGDMTPFSRRDNVLIVREIDGKKYTGRIDLRTPALYSSPYYYLQQNDLVYIEPNRKKPTGNEQVLMRNVAIITSIVSVAAILLTLTTQ